MQYRFKKIDYTSPASAQGGPGIQKAVTWYVGTPYLNMTAAQMQLISADTGLTLGDVWTLGGQAQASGGNAFMFAYAAETLALGQLVANRPPTATVDDAGGAAATVTVPGAGTAASPLTTTASATTNIDDTAFALPVGVNGDVGNWLYVNATGATLPQLRRIKYNSSSTTTFYKVALPDFMRPNTPTDVDVFDTLATNGDTCCVIRPYHVVVNNSSTYGGAGISTTPIGVALGAVTAGNYTIIQVRGLAPVQAVGNGVGTGLVVNRPAVGSTDGVIIGSAASAANLYTAASLILPQFATTAAALTIPCFVNFMAQ